MVCGSNLNSASHSTVSCKAHANQVQCQSCNTRSLLFIGLTDKRHMGSADTWVQQSPCITSLQRKAVTHREAFQLCHEACMIGGLRNTKGEPAAGACRKFCHMTYGLLYSMFCAMWHAQQMWLGHRIIDCNSTQTWSICRSCLCHEYLATSYQV